MVSLSTRAGAQRSWLGCDALGLADASHCSGGRFGSMPAPHALEASTLMRSMRRSSGSANPRYSPSPGAGAAPNPARSGPVGRQTPWLTARLSTRPPRRSATATGRSGRITNVSEIWNAIVRSPGAGVVVTSVSYAGIVTSRSAGPARRKSMSTVAATGGASSMSSSRSSAMWSRSGMRSMR